MNVYQECLFNSYIINAIKTVFLLLRLFHNLVQKQKKQITVSNGKRQQVAMSIKKNVMEDKFRGKEIIGIC